jgi:hypothetical protein
VRQVFEGPPGQVVRAQTVLESAVGGARIDEKRVPQLADVPEALDRRRVDHRQGVRLEADVVPERVADDFERRG